MENNYFYFTQKTIQNIDRKYQKKPCSQTATIRKILLFTEELLNREKENLPKNLLLTRNEFQTIIKRTNPDLSDLETPFNDMTRIMESLGMCEKIKSGRKTIQVLIKDTESWEVKWK